MMSFFHSCFICIHVLFHLLSKMFYTYTYARILNSIKIMNDFSEMIHSLVAFFKLLHHFFKIYTGIQYLQIPCTFIIIISTSVLNLKYFMINRYLKLKFKYYEIVLYYLLNILPKKKNTKTKNNCNASFHLLFYDKSFKK